MIKINSKLFLKSMLIVSMLFGVLIFTDAQEKEKNQQTIEMPKADLLFKRQNSEAIVFQGNVVFHHNGAYMHCDSAYLYEQDKVFEAFDNVRIEQGDSLFIYGDYLHYDVNTQLASLRKNIRMEHKNMTLFTDSLDYDREINVGYYFDGGMIVDEENELTSYWGQYDPTTKDAFFEDSVKLVNKDYKIFSDTLQYNTESKIATILGESTIVSDSGFVKANKGWYDTVLNESMLLDRSEIYNNDTTQVLIGDSIFYNRNTGQGEVFGNMHLEDFKRKNILKGNYGIYNQKTNSGFATDSAYVIDYSNQDSLFLSADTLRMVTDSIYKNIYAHKNVRFFRTDMQGLSDSARYIQKDSVVLMRGNPIVWNNSNQISGEEIDVFIADSTINRAVVNEYAFAVQKRPYKNQFNQLSGRKLTAYFNDNKIYHIFVEGDAKSIYYSEDEEKKSVTGINRTESPYMAIDIKDNLIEKMKCWPNPKSSFPPPSLAKEEDLKLNGLVWLEYMRPKDKTDIFRANSRKTEDSEIKRPKKFNRDQNDEY